MSVASEIGRIQGLKKTLADYLVSIGEAEGTENLEELIGKAVGLMGVVDTEMSDTSENAVQNKVIKEYVDGRVGDLSALTTTNKASAVAAINELDFAVKGLGEPFRVKNWASNTLNVQIPHCAEDLDNTAIPKMDFSIDNVEGADYQVVGMVAYEVKGADGKRINCWPVCQFTGNGQKTLSVRWMCGGTSRKTAVSINAWVLLKHR